MACDVVETRYGPTFIICSRGKRQKKCQFCDSPAAYECDASRPRKKSGTCDARMCETHRWWIAMRLDSDTNEVDSVDLCPRCARPTPGKPTGARP